MEDRLPSPPPKTVSPALCRGGGIAIMIMIMIMIDRAAPLCDIAVHCLHTAVLKRSLNERSQDSFLLCVLNEWYSREQAAPFAAPRSKIFAVRYCALQYCRQALWRGVAACLTDAAGEAEAGAVARCGSLSHGGSW